MSDDGGMGMNVTRRICALGATAVLVAIAIMPAAVAAPGNATDRIDVIVTFDEDTRGPAAAAAVAASHGMELGHVYEHALDGFSGAVPQGRLTGLRNDPRVAAVSPDSLMQAQAPKWCSEDPSHPACGGDEDDGADDPQQVPWGIDRIGAQDSTVTGEGVHVYVLDTGIDADHPDLEANLGAGKAVIPCGGSCTTSWDDDQGHGTHVAGTIGALENDIDVVGVAPGVTLHAVKVLDGQGSGPRSDVIAGIDWVTAEVVAHEQPAVVNMSLGGGGAKLGTCTEEGLTGADDDYHAAICNARNAGAVFAVAAGNDGADAAGTVPAAYDDAVITVSATDSSDAWVSFSNWGDDEPGWTENASAPVALAAPGVSVLSTAKGGGTSTKSGTSMATPHVAGAAALLLDSGAASTFGQVRAALLDAAEDTGGFGNSTGDPHDEDFLQVTAAPSTSEPVRAYPTSASTDEGDPVTFSLEADHVDGCDAELLFTIVEGPSHGSVKDPVASGCDAGLHTASVTYEPDEDYVGDDEFTFSVTDGTNSASAVVSLEVIAVDEPPAETGTMTVDRIDSSGWGGSSGDKHLAVEVLVVDGSNSPLGGADVTVTIHHDDSTGVYGPWTATTSSEGIARFELKNAPSGSYRTDIESVELAGYKWDGS